jgi:hypothetical protein
LPLPMKRFWGVDAPYSMPRPIAISEDPRLLFARQLYERCLERLGAQHEETRLVARYIHDLECGDLNNAVPPSRSPLRSQLPNTLFARETTFVPLRSSVI